MSVAYRLAALLAAMITGLMFIATAPASAAGHRTLWREFYTSGTPADESGALAEAMSPGSATVYVAGFTGYTSQEGATGGATLAYDAATGATRWTETTPSTSTDVIVPQAVAVSPDGTTVFDSGYYQTRSAFGAVTIAYNAATGASVWMQRHAGVDTPISVAVSPDGSRLFVMTEGGEILAYATATGKLLWGVSPSASYFATAAALSPDGSKVFITGNGQTAAYDAGTGALLWSQQYGSASAGAPLVNGTSLAVSPDGSTVYVAGTSNHVTHGGIVAYASTSGTIEWATVVPRIFGGSATAKVPAVAVAPGGATLFVTGGGRDSRGNSDLVTQARAASTGTALWSRHYESKVPESDTGPGNIAVSPNGSAVFVTGTISTPGEEFNTTVGYKADTGATLWNQGAGGAAATVVSPDGSKLFVCGTEQFGTQHEFATTAFRS